MKKKKAFIFGVSNQKKYLSFHSLPGYEIISEETIENMWELVHYYRSRIPGGLMSGTKKEFKNDN